MADDKATRTNWWDVFFVSLGIIVFIAASAIMFGLAMTGDIL